MAWNPTPEVQVARDAAKALTKAGRFIDRCVVIYTTEQGQMGYASYGKNTALCGQARRLGDAAYEAVGRAIENDVFAFHHRHDSGGTLLDGAAVDWDDLEREVALKLRLLRESLRAMPCGAASGAAAPRRHIYMRDLVLPAVELLARFCMCVQIEEEVAAK